MLAKSRAVSYAFSVADHFKITSDRISVVCVACTKWIDGEVHVIDLNAYCEAHCPLCHPPEHEFKHEMPTGGVGGHQEGLF